MANKITDKECIDAYQKHKHLKKAADEIGIKWQTLYCRLKKNGIKVVGDKTKYGSMSDKIGAKGENEFKKLVPLAIDENQNQFQAPIDFTVNGYGVDVKVSGRKKSGKKYSSQRWAFSIKKQESKCDFFVMMAYSEDHLILEKVFLIPADMCRFLQSISISVNGTSKWLDYEVQPEDLECFFNSL